MLALNHAVLARGRAQCQPWCNPTSCGANQLGSCGGCDVCASPIRGMSCLVWGMKLIGQVAVLDTTVETRNASGHAASAVSAGPSLVE